MVKKILQDVIPPGKKTIRHIPLPQTHHVAQKDDTLRPGKKRKRLNMTKWGVIILAIIILVGAFIALSSIFASATVNVTPKQATASIDSVVLLGEQAGYLQKILVTSTSTISSVIPSEKTENVERKASGQIVIYNNYSAESQRLIKNTRFQAVDGRIYKINNSVIVPGQKVEDGKKIPGSVTVTVYADAAGPEFNMSLSDLKGDFTIPGFKGMKQYETFFARLKTDITGGFFGKERVPNKEALNAELEALKIKLSDEIWSELAASLPKDHFSSKELFEISFSASTSDDPSGDGVLVSVTGIGRVLALNKEELSRTLAEKSLTEYKSQPVIIHNLDDLSFSVNSPENSLGSEKLSVGVKGNARFIWILDEEGMKESLSGKDKDDTTSILKKFPAIERAEAVIKPTWLSQYPKSINKIKLNIDYNP